MSFWSSRDRRRLSVVARALAQHAVVSVMALVVVGATATIICVRVVQGQALRQAEGGGEVVATRIVAPLVTPSLSGNPKSISTRSGRVWSIRRNPSPAVPAVPTTSMSVSALSASRRRSTSVWWSSTMTTLVTGSTLSPRQPLGDPSCHPSQPYILMRICRVKMAFLVMTARRSCRTDQKLLLRDLPRIGDSPSLVVGLPEPDMVSILTHEWGYRPRHV